MPRKKGVKNAKSKPTAADIDSMFKDFEEKLHQLWMTNSGEAKIIVDKHLKAIEKF